MTGSFYKIKKVLSSNRFNNDNDDMLYSSRLIVDSEVVTHYRKSYNFADFFGDLGGFIELIIKTFIMITYPFAQFSFHLKAIQKMFLARTGDDNLFNKSKILSGKTMLRVPTL